MTHMLLPYNTVGRNGWGNTGYTVHVFARDEIDNLVEARAKVGYVENFCGGEFVHSPDVVYRTAPARREPPRAAAGDDWDMDVAATRRGVGAGKSLTTEQWDSVIRIGDDRFWWGPDDRLSDKDKMLNMLGAILASHIIGNAFRGAIYLAGPCPGRLGTVVRSWPKDRSTSDSFNCYRVARCIHSMALDGGMFVTKTVEGPRACNLQGSDLLVPPYAVLRNPNSGRNVAQFAVGGTRGGRRLDNRLRVEYEELVVTAMPAYRKLYRHYHTNTNWRVH